MKKITDKMRLDWLSKAPSDNFELARYQFVYGDLEQFRDAIDAAIRKEATNDDI